jgi:hypothetical protein
MGLNTGCWKAGRTYANSPIAGLIVATYLQPGGSSTLGYTVSWAAENARNVAVRLVISYVLPNSRQPSVHILIVQPGAISPTTNWNFPEGATNFQLGAESIG